MKNKKNIPLLLCLLILAVTVSGFLFWKSSRRTDPISITDFKLNTVVSITLYKEKERPLLAKAMELCDKYEALFSRTLPDSEIYQLNHGTLPSQNGFYQVSSPVRDLAEKGLYYSRLSQGAFDLSLAPVSSLWDFSSEIKKIPSQKELQAALPLVDYKNIIVNDQGICFKKEGMGLDTGAIAKGYIADQIKEFLVSNGVKNGIINLGGNVLCIGTQPDGTPFHVGIQKPFSNHGETALTVEVSDCSVVSSGIYERCFEQNGEFYHHLLNPQTGMPIHNELASVTILSRSSVDGDALSTTCFALGLQEGTALLEQLEHTEGVFITLDGHMHFTSGFPQ